MRRIILFILLLLLYACTTVSEPIPSKPILPEELSEEFVLELLPPLENGSPNTSFEPAFDGQTRAPSTKTKVSYEYNTLNSELIEPWGIDVLPDGKLVITEKQGRLAILEADGTLITRVTGFPSINTQNQGGLLDVSISPTYADDSMIFFTFALLTNQGSATAVGKAKLNLVNNQLDDFETIFVALPYLSGNNHLGGRIVFDELGNIYLSTGDRQDTNRRMQAQDMNSGIGKIHYFTQNGSVVSGYDSTVFSLGHRNVQGLGIHPLTNELWASEMGPQGGDELNLILTGKNYGWPIVSYGEEYNGNPIPGNIAQKEGMEEPRYYWDPVIAPSGMVFYDGLMFEEWQNNLFIAGLRSESIVRVILDGNRIVAEEQLLGTEKQRFRDLAQGIDGSLYAVTDAGRLYQIKTTN